jgi:hypothetical protein
LQNFRDSARSDVAEYSYNPFKKNWSASTGSGNKEVITFDTKHGTQCSRTVSW